MNKIKNTPCLHGCLAVQKYNSMAFSLRNYYEFDITVLIVISILYRTVSELFFSLCMFYILKEEISS